MRQQRLWSDWASAQSDLSLRWAHVISLVLPCTGSNVCNKLPVAARHLEGRCPIYWLCDLFYYEKELGYTCRGYSVEACSCVEPHRPVGTHRAPIGALCEGSSMRLYIAGCRDLAIRIRIMTVNLSIVLNSQRVRNELPHPLPLPMSTNAKRLSFFL